MLSGNQCRAIVQRERPGNPRRDWIAGSSEVDRSTRAGIHGSSRGQTPIRTPAPLQGSENSDSVAPGGGSVARVVPPNVRPRQSNDVASVHYRHSGPRRDCDREPRSEDQRAWCRNSRRDLVVRVVEDRLTLFVDASLRLELDTLTCNDRSRSGSERDRSSPHRIAGGIRKVARTCRKRVRPRVLNSHLVAHNGDNATRPGCGIVTRAGGRARN